MPVLETPFLDDGALDLDGFDAVVAHSVSAGADGLMFPGFASEFYKLTEGERDELTSHLLAVTAGHPRVMGIVSITDNSTRVATAHVERAIEGGADAINVLPPFAVPSSAPEVVAHLDAILEAAGNVPVVLQFSPQQTGSSLSAADIRGLADARTNLAAVKVESVPPGPLVSALLAGSPRVTGIVGYAGLHLLDALERGAIGVQPGCSMPELYRGILDAWADGARDLAAERHARLLPYLSYWMTNVELIVRVEKLISQRRGLIRSDHCRAPSRRLDDHETASVERFLAEFERELAR
jgi:dihydrodipicolinate synthase/N-acetylneuraminate lyase